MVRSTLNLSPELTATGRLQPVSKNEERLSIVLIDVETGNDLRIEPCPFVNVLSFNTYLRQNTVWPYLTNYTRSVTPSVDTCVVHLSGFIPVVYSLLFMHVIIEVLMGDAVNPTHMGDIGGTDGAAKGKGSNDTTIRRSLRPDPLVLHLQWIQWPERHSCRYVAVSYSAQCPRLTGSCTGLAPR